MPLRLPDRLPAIELLKHENIFVMDTTRAHHQDIRPLRIVILNLMPIRVGKQLRIIPELRFFVDDSLDYVEHIDELLHNS